MVDIATGQIEDTVSSSMKLTVRKGRAGGLRGGKARASRLTAEERKAIAKLAARSRWKKVT
jgi:hypothetical protein